MVKILLTPDDRVLVTAETEQTVATTVTPAVATQPVHVSWLKRVGQVIGRILGIVAKDAAPVANVAASVAEALLPQFAPEIAVADGLVSRIAKEAIAIEGAAASTGQASGTGPQKLATVLSNIGPALDQWVALNFPGAAAVGTAEKAGLVNAVVAILNKIEGNPAIAS
jgi:hypothetical protein